MQEKPDYYEVLEVNKNATADEIKKAYRRLAMQHHPDRNGDDKEAEHRFKQINEAYDVLKDEQKRAAYDRFGHSAFQNGGAGQGFGGFEFNMGGGFSDIFEDIFNEFMGGGRTNSANSRRSQGIRGNDLKINLTLTLEEAFEGVHKQIKVPTMEKCSDCNGFGTVDGKEPPICPVCNGTGKIRTQRGFFMMEQTCHNCNGLGRAAKDKCKKCKGQGRVKFEKTLEVNIPKGIEDGSRIRLTGEGEVGLLGGANGDLYLFISVKQHKTFMRKGNDLLMNLPISMICAALGDEIMIQTLDGEEKLKIPEGTQPDTQFRLKGKGMPVMQSSKFGDLYINVNVEIPTKLSKKQKELLKQIKDLS